MTIDDPIRRASVVCLGAGGYTGTLLAHHAHELGLRPLLAGRSAPPIAALAEGLDLPHRVLALDEPAAMEAALADVDLVLNAAGPFLHTAAPLADACLEAGVHYLDISNELQVFRTSRSRFETPPGSTPPPPERVRPTSADGSSCRDRRPKFGDGRPQRSRALGGALEERVPLVDQMRTAAGVRTGSSLPTP